MGIVRILLLPHAVKPIEFSLAKRCRQSLAALQPPCIAAGQRQRGLTGTPPPLSRPGIPAKASAVRNTNLFSKFSSDRAPPDMFPLPWPSQDEPAWQGRGQKERIKTKHQHFSPEYWPIWKRLGAQAAPKTGEEQHMCGMCKSLKVL